MEGAVRRKVKAISERKQWVLTLFTQIFTHDNNTHLIPLDSNPIVRCEPTTERLSSVLTCQWREGEVLRLAALPLAVNDVEVDFDRMAD